MQLRSTSGLTERRSASVVFAANAHGEAGLGHLNRCVATANAIVRSQPDISVCLMAIDPAPDLQFGTDRRVQVRSLSYAQAHSDPGSVIPDEDRETLLVLDHYNLGTLDWLSRFRALSPIVPVLAFDDVGSGATWPVLGLIRAGIGSKINNREGNGKRFDAIGPSFFPLRDEVDISKSCARSTAKESQLRILVTMGGADPELHTERIVNVLAMLAADAHFDIVFGPGASAARARAPIPDRRFTFHHCPEDFPSLMRSADLALTGGGNTCHELLWLGVPVMGFCLAENQLSTCEALTREDCGHYSGILEQLSDEDIIEQLDFLIAHPHKRAEMARRGRTLIDGKGAERLAGFIVDTWKGYFSDNFSESSVRDEYDESAVAVEEHEKVRWGSDESMRNRMRMAIARIDWASVRTWADIGAATGLLLTLAEETATIERFIGIDLSTKLLEFAHSRTYRTGVVSFENRSFMSEVPGEPFSLVTALGVLQKCGLSMERAIARMGQMTATGGQLFLTTKNAAWHQFDEESFKPFPGHHWFDPARVLEACRWGGLRVLGTGAFDSAKNEVSDDIRAHSNFYVHARKLPW